MIETIDEAGDIQFTERKTTPNLLLTAYDLNFYRF